MYHDNYIHDWGTALLKINNNLELFIKAGACVCVGPSIESLNHTTGTTFCLQRRKVNKGIRHVTLALPLSSATPVLSLEGVLFCFLNVCVQIYTQACFEMCVCLSECVYIHVSTTYTTILEDDHLAAGSWWIKPIGNSLEVFLRLWISFVFCGGSQPWPYPHI